MYSLWNKHSTGRLWGSDFSEPVPMQLLCRDTWRIANMESILKYPANPSGRTCLFLKQSKSSARWSLPSVMGKISLREVCSRQYRCRCSGISGQREDMWLEEMDQSMSMLESGEVEQCPAQHCSESPDSRSLTEAKEMRKSNRHTGAGAGYLSRYVSIQRIWNTGFY